MARTLSEAASASTPSQSASGRLLPLPLVTPPVELGEPPDRSMAAAMTMTVPAGLPPPPPSPQKHSIFLTSALRLLSLG